MPLDILFEDNHCLAVDKPAGLLSQGDASGDPSALEFARAYIQEKYEKPGAVFLGLVHRLDRPVSGVLLFARTSKAAARLSAQFREGSVAKTYWAIVEGRVPVESGTWADRLVKDARRNVVEVIEGAEGAGRVAALDFQVLGRGPRTTWLELRPRTGRSHQLRVQLATRGWPIVGDRKYGARSRLVAPDGGPRIALHARTLGFNHPTQRRWIEVTAPVPAGWPWPSS